MEKKLNKMYDAELMPIIEEAFNKQKKNTITIVISNPDGDKCALSMCFALDTKAETYRFFPFFYNVNEDVDEWIHSKLEVIIKMLFDNKVEPFKYTDENEVVLFVENEMKHSLNGELDMLFKFK